MGRPAIRCLVLALLLGGCGRQQDAVEPVPAEPGPAADASVDAETELWLVPRGAESPWHVRVAGAPLPAKVRLLPVSDLNLIGPAVFSGGYALVPLGGGPALLVDHPGVGGKLFPLERAPRATRGKAMTDEQALAGTVTLRYLKTCPSGQSECFLYGPLADVEASSGGVSRCTTAARASG